MGTGGGPGARGRGPGAVGGPHAGQDLGHARHPPPAAGGRAGHVASGFSTYRRHRKGAWLRYFGVTPEEVDRLLDAITEALDGRTLTREELATEVGRLTGSADLGAKLRESWGSLLKPAAFEGRLCFAPGCGQHVCFTRPDQWLPDWAAVDPATALPEITRRFFAAHGPATREDLARWWGVSPAAASRLVRALGDEQAPVDVEAGRGLDGGRRRRRGAGRRPDRRGRHGPPAAGVRPLRGGRRRPRRRPPSGGLPGPGLPPPGVAVAGAAGGGAHGRCGARRPEAGAWRCRSSSSWSRRPRPGERPRRRRSAWPLSSAPPWTSPGPDLPGGQRSAR